MKEINAYLVFDGNCREAMKFYEKCLHAELQMMPFSSADVKPPAGAEERIMHAKLTSKKAVLMASDNMPGMPFQQGNNVSLSVDCDSQDEAKRLFVALGEKGTVTMPLQDTFWGAYFGMLTDQFGIHWMFNFDKPKQN